ncbi:MAG: hypothetical protein WKG07_04955 [Hymenobacter sp.]
MEFEVLMPGRCRHRRRRPRVRYRSRWEVRRKNPRRRQGRAGARMP